MSGDIASNLARVNARIEAACLRAGRDPASVRLLPVTKTLSPERVREGQSTFDIWTQGGRSAVQTTLNEE